MFNTTLHHSAFHFSTRLLTCLAVFAWLSPAQSDAASPNIIVIVADDLGHNDLSCMGQTNFTTPRLDAMASEGMRFTQFYAGCTVCAPSRACLLTGQHTGHVYQRFNGSVQFREDPLDMTIATRLQQTGYQTAMIGKSGLSCNSPDADLPHRKGFDFFFGFTSHGAAHRYYPKSMWKNGESIQYPGNHGKEGETYTGDVFLEESLNWLDANHSQPFFLHMALQQPHADLQVPKKYREKHLKTYDETPNSDGHYRGETHPKATFVGMIDYLDESVGKVIDKLKELGVDDNTMVIFTSDNGPHYEGGHSPEALDSNGIYRGGKRDLYEGGIRVPMIVRWPAAIAPGGVSDHVSAFWDLPATFCELAGLAVPDDFDGISLVPTLLGTGDQSNHEYLYWEFYEQGGKQAVRAGDWKAIRLDVSKDPNGPLELYDLSDDPSESTNVADANPDITEQLADLISQAHIPSDSISFSKGPLKTKKTPTARLGKRLSPSLWADRSSWELKQCNSESKQNDRTIDKVLDGDPRTHWHTNFQGKAPQHPHWFIIDLGETVDVVGAGFLARQDGQLNGMIAEVEIQFSDTPEFISDGQGTRQNAVLKGTPDEQHVDLRGRGRYVKVIIDSAVDQGKFASLAEFNLELAGNTQAAPGP